MAIVIEAGKRNADAKKQGNQRFYRNVEKAAADRARMERATLDYATRQRNRSAGWQYRVLLQERKGNKGIS